MTQADLADQLGVTNKAVSKWETGEAFPETAQLKPLSNIFGVTIDELLKGGRNPNLADESIDNQTLKVKGRETLNYDYAQMTKKQAWATVVSVSIILIGAIFSIIADAYEISYLIYVPVVLFCVAAAVFILMIFKVYKSLKRAGIEGDNFKKGKMYSLICSLGVFLIVISPIPIIVLPPLHVNAKIFLPIFSAVLTAGIFMVILGAMQWAGFKKMNSITRQYKDKKTLVYRELSGIIMLGAVVVYLLLGFIWELWSPGWVIFPVAALVTAMIRGIMRLCNEQGEDK